MIDVHRSMIICLICFWLISLYFFVSFIFEIFLDWSSASCCFVVDEALLRRDFGVEEEMAVRSDRSHTLRNYLLVCMFICEVALLLISVLLILRFLCLLPSFLDAGARLLLVILVR